jgi:predicted Abi (CAAX) family protease
LYISNVHYNRIACTGHGIGIKDDDYDEEDGMDETLVPSDFNKSGLIRDDDVLTTLVKPMARGVFVTAIMDCCHSGTILDLPYNFKADGQMVAMVPNNTTTSIQGRAIRKTTSRVSSVFSQSSEDSSQESVNLIPRIDSDPSLSAKDLSFENMKPPSIQVPRLPIAEWSGRLSFYREHRVKDIDGIYIQLYHAPKEFTTLIGKKLFLTWEKNHLTDQFIRQCKRNVFFSKVAKDNEPDLVLPKRLDGEMAIGPLESLAGSRSSNDMFCMLEGNVTFKPMKIVDGDLKTDGTLFINEEPIQISGVYYSVVKFLGPLSEEKDNDLYQVQHFNPSSGKLDGMTEVIRLPYKVYQAKTGILNSNNRKIETSKVNIDGYYIYGEYGNDGIFTLKALDPRRAVILRPDTYIIKEKRLGRKFLREIIWEDTPMSRGKMGTAIIDQTWATLDLSMKRWVEGKRFLVIHVIGDCTHNKRNFKRLIKGHFAFGSATVIRDPLTNELCFDIVYDQIHPHNSEGIVSGKVIRSSHLGNLQRGAINTKPVCDVIVDLETITKDFKFGGTNFTIFEEIQNQLQKKMGLYRVGNGRGVAAVTKTEKACQDANEAFCAAIDKIEDAIANDYIAKKWFKLYPNYEGCQRFRKLQKLGKALSSTMCPMGMDRKDWRYNQNQFQGNEVDDFIPNCMSFQNDGENNPRQCLYLLCKTFLDHGAGLWVIRTNQAGGRMKHIYPLAPTTSGFTGKQKVPTK